MGPAQPGPPESAKKSHTSLRGNIINRNRKTTSSSGLIPNFIDSICVITPEIKDLNNSRESFGLWLRIGLRTRAL
jgi:hypothetical protein